MTTPTVDRVKKHRAALRASGLRPLQVWVPDTNRPGFAAECRRQSRVVAAAAAQSEQQASLEQVADTDGWR